MDDAELEEIEQRANRASPGPWRIPFGPERHALAKTPSVRKRREAELAAINTYAWVWDDDERAVLSTPGGEFTTNGRMATIHRRALHDLEFAAHARIDVPALVAEIRRLKGLLDA